METRAVIVLVIGTVVVLLVPALVWSRGIAGLYETAQNNIWESLKAVRQKVAAAVSTK